VDAGGSDVGECVSVGVGVSVSVSVSGCGNRGKEQTSIVRYLLRFCCARQDNCKSDTILSNSATPSGSRLFSLSIDIIICMRICELKKRFVKYKIAHSIYLHE
jgi:hypothetical protein